MATAREKAKIQNSLLTLIQAMEGEVLTVELRNESSVTGILNSVDMFMNLTMSHVDFTQTNGISRSFESFYVKGFNVRYIPIPSHIDMTKAVENQLKGYQNRREKKKRTENWIKKHKRRQNIKNIEAKLRQKLEKHESSKNNSASAQSAEAN